MDAAETRFAHLLQPIRDLTKNWEVDVASQLAEYLDELDKICISFDEGKTTMNFAEAALLIQSSACIYSKKVEYLYSLVYQALDLISKKKRDKQPSSVRQDGADNDVTFGNKKHKVEFLTLDDISEMNSPNSEMKKDTADGLEIISLTPGPLIPAEEQDKRKNPLYSFRGEVLASCKDFRINNFTPHSSGIIRLDSLSTPSQFLRDLPARQPAFDVSSTVPVDFNCHGVPLPPLRLSEAPDGDGSIEVQDAANEDGAFLPLEDGGMELEQQAVIHMDRHQATHERRVLREQPEAQRTPEEYKELPDPWRWLDPYSALGDKPIKTGKHFTIPRGVQDISGNKRKRKALAKLQDFTSWFNGTLSEASNRKPKRGPTFAGLEDLYWSCMKERLKMQRTFHRKAGIFSCRDTFMEKSLELGGAERQAEEEEEAQPEAFWDNNAVDDLSDHNIYPDEAPFQDLEQQDLLTASRTDRMSYEDLVRKNVELFLVNSQKYAQETVLSRRVKDWEEKISPQLKLQEERLVFNIHDYGNQVVDTFSSIGQTRSFASVVHGKESHEVCRYLLASLQLANDYTIEIHQEEGLEEAIDTMTLTLLSKQRAHERFKTYTAPSVAPGGTFLLPAERSPGVSSHAKAPVASTAQTERHRTKTTFWNRRIRDVTKASPTSSNAHTDHHGGLAAAVCSQDECTTTSCHPQLGDLMVGRGGRLSATSTCGLDGPQNYCIIGHLEDEKKCFSCDSRQPYNRYTNPRSHRIENVITTFDPKRRMKWWQSENGVHEVSIQLDLETVFQFSHLVLTFKSFRPSAMLVERSKDNGRTWTVFRYFAEDCGSSFPRVPAGAASSVGDVVCDTRYSGAEPSTGGEVVLKALDPSFQINDPYSPEIQELITMTNLRVNFTRLLTLGDALLGRRRRNPQDKYYYALYEMVVRGTCFCNGHASQCVPVDGTRGDVIVEPGMVHGHCVCQHNTAGNNCERCQDLYNDAPWRPAGHSNPHPCKKCNCNGHSERCHFDMARYISTGGVSGGVCDECGNNRVGVHCERCRASYYRDPQRAQNDLDACVPCNCDPFGSLDGGLCDPGTSRCICKRHVEGDRCDRCRYGFYGLSRDNPDGCTVCGCNPLGSVETPYPCDPVTGQCFCKPFATGPMCDRCLSGYWGLGNTVHSCSPCDCDIGGAQDSRCNPLDGQCRCRPNMVGPRCKDPAIGYFLAPLDFYLYEAEHAAPLQGSAQSLVNPTGLPRCEQFFRDQGYDFRLHNGNFILIKRTKRRGRQRRQEQTSIPLHPGLPLQIIPRQRIPGRPVTWTGPGFVRVQHGAGLRFTVNNLPVALDYYLVFRYEPESSDIWAAKVKVIPRTSLTKRRCANDPVDITVTLPGSSRMALLETPICLEDDALYYVDTIFEKQSNLDPQQSSHILIDSMGLIPRIESLLGFCSEMKLEEFEQYHCLEVASQLRPQILPEVCEDLIVSMSARIHNGAVACRCNPIGSHSQSCGKFGGQCDCKPSVIGRCCDTCAPHTFGFGPNGCTLCDCDPRGSVLEMCDQASGQCVCRPEVSGQRCDRCRPGYFGFPLCRPCQCNGLADLCDPVSGACVDCRNHAAGLHCDRCVDGYYGNLAFGEPCQPCLCPDTKASGRFFARSCSKDPNSLHVLCHCEPGHSGPRCDVCSPGFYGNLALPGAHCQECQCNSNIDPQDRGSCDPITGTCLRCLHHTYGSACESCEPGYYGDALAHNCRECRCDPQGTEANMCPTGGPCLCQQSSGQCPCQPGVAGTSCDECQQGFWGFTSEAGCQLCDCDPAWSLSDQCDKVTGQCPCHPEFGGRRCDECGENFFWSPDLQCISCDCNMDGTERPSCDHYTGKCLCRPGVVGSLCSECASGHGPPFPDCPICHDCWNLWAENVTVLQGQIERISTMVKQRDPQLHPSYSPWLDELDAMLDRIRNLIGDTTAETKMTEKLSEQIKTFRDTVDPHIIIIDTSPLLNTLIDNIRNEFHRLLGKLEKVKPNKYGDLKVLEEALRKIRKYHAEVKEAEEQCKDAKAMLAASRQKRQVAKDKLDSRLVEGWDTLERKVKALNVTSLYEDICGSPTCTASVLVGQNVTELPEQTKSDIARVLLSLSDSKRKIQEAKKKSQDTKSKAEELKKKIDKSLEKFEREKNKTKDLIKQVKEFLTDEMVRPEDIEMVVTAVLAIQLPSSPEEIGDLVNKIRSILVNSTKLLKDLEQLREEARTAQDLLQRAEEVRNKTRSIDVSEIKKAVKDAEKIQDNVSRYLVNAKNNITSTAKQLEEIDAKLNDTETLFNASRIKDLVEQVEALKNKTEMNRLQGQEAKAAADSALKNATATKMILDEVNTLFQELEKKKDNGTKELVDERLKNITMEAESIAKEVKDKMTQVEDLEKKIVQLLQVKNEKAVEVDELLQKVDDIRRELAERAVAYAKC